MGYRVRLWLMIAWGQIEDLEEVDPEWQALLPKYPTEAIKPVRLIFHFIFICLLILFIDSSYPTLRLRSRQSSYDVSRHSRVWTACPSDENYDHSTSPRLTS